MLTYPESIDNIQTSLSRANIQSKQKQTTSKHNQEAVANSSDFARVCSIGPRLN